MTHLLKLPVPMLLGACVLVVVAYLTCALAAGCLNECDLRLFASLGLRPSCASARQVGLRKLGNLVLWIARA